MPYIDIHIVSDASLIGFYTIAYAAINQKNIVSRNLIIS